MFFVRGVMTKLDFNRLIWEKIEEDETGSGFEAPKSVNILTIPT